LKPASRPANQDASVELAWRRCIDFGFLGIAPLSRFIKAALAQNRNRTYVRWQKVLAFVTPGRGLRILFSSARPEWREGIMMGFSRTRHRVEFGSLTPENAGEYDLAIPLSLAEQEHVRLWSSAASAGSIPILSEECVRLCDNKYEFNLALCNAGFGRYIPKMGTGNGQPLAPPYILKKRAGEWGQVCTMVLNH
jgi:hypothetical protein